VINQQLDMLNNTLLTTIEALNKFNMQMRIRVADVNSTLQQIRETLDAANKAKEKAEPIKEENVQPSATEEQGSDQGVQE